MWPLQREMHGPPFFLCKQRHKQTRSHSEITHAGSGSKFNVTVQLKASEVATVTLVGRREWSRLHTGRRARLMANLSTRMHAHTHTYADTPVQPEVTLSDVNCTTLLNRIRNQYPHAPNRASVWRVSPSIQATFVYAFLCGTVHGVGDSQHTLLAHPSPPLPLSLNKEIQFTRETLWCCCIRMNQV